MTTKLQNTNLHLIERPDEYKEKTTEVSQKNVNFSRSGRLTLDIAVSEVAYFSIFFNFENALEQSK